MNPKDDDEKKHQGVEESRKILERKEDFETKLQEIANNEQYDWIAAIMAIDHFDSFVFLNNDNKEVIESEIVKMEQEISQLFDIFGNGTNKNKMKYFGYKLNRDGNRIGLILYDSKDTSVCFCTRT